MDAIKARVPIQIKQAEFHLDYIWVALAAALFIGFALGAHVAAVIGLDFPLGPAFYSFVQVHGHVQLVAWVGLFIISISLHFIPRLAGVPITHPKWIAWILWLIASGIILRSLGQCVMPYIVNGALFAPVVWMAVASGLLEWTGIILYAALLLSAFRRIEDLGKRPGLSQVAPFFLMMLAGWNLYAGINLALLMQMALSNSLVVIQAWNEFAIQAFMGLVLMPVAFAFSVRMIPGFMQKKMIWSSKLVEATFWLGNAAAIFRIVPLLLPVAVFETIPAMIVVSQAAFAVSGIVMMAAISCLAINLMKTV